MELFGRESERKQVVERLAHRRLVTICGPGGIGKTTLAGAVAREVADDYDLGVATVDLTRIDDPAAVPEAIAGQLGFADFESLRDSTSERSILLVIDNCEHVIDAAAAAVAQLLDASPAPRIIATSRTPLDASGESIVSLAPLPIPRADAVGADTPSMQLLMARARDQGVELGPDHEEAMAEVCRRLDGVPLAIEIAAARLRTIGLGDLVDQLDQPGVLTRRRFRGRTAHASLAGLVDWSYRLLDADQQRAFEELAVFAGPFTGDLARSVVAPDGEADWEEIIDGLVAASLVVVDHSVEPVRYRLLHPVRAVAGELLDRSGRADEVRSRLVDIIIGETLAIVQGGPDGWRPADLHGLLDLYDHTAASIRWLLDHDDDPERALLLVAVLWGIVHNAHSNEIHALGESVLERWPDPSLRRWSSAAATVATCRFLAGDTGGAIALAEQALAHAGTRRSAPALLLRVRAQSRRADGDLAGARAGFAEAAAVSADRGAHGLAMEMRVDEALAMVEQGEGDDGVRRIEEVVVEADRRGALINKQWAEVSRAAALIRGDARSSQAVTAVAESVASARELGYPAGIAFGLRLQAEVELADDRLADAAGTVVELLDELSRRGGLDEMRYVLDLAAEVMRRRRLDGWADLLATAMALPITSFLTPLAPAVPADAVVAGTVLSTREAYVRCRQAMLGINIGIDIGIGADPAAPMIAEVRPAAEHDGSPPAGETVPAGGPVPEGDAEPAVEAELADEGDVWRVTWGGSTIRVRRSKGLADLAVLVADPGREVLAADLTGGVAPSTDDEVLDAEARRRYEDRVRDLQADIEEAEADNDTGRAERARLELDAIVDQLTEAVGLGGRSRRMTGDAERARSAVTQRLRSTIRRIGDLHPDLGAHLDQSITTGTSCAYRPHPPVRWRIER